MKKQLAPLLCAPLFAAALQLSAQTQGYPDQSLQPTGQTTAVDCSDPLQATSAQCSFFQRPSAGSPLLPSMQNFGSSLPGQPAENYTETENLVRQAGQNPNGLQQQPLPPEPLTEFQKFVASTTGEVLPIKGADLFRDVPSTFAPLDLTPVPPDYTIGPGDELRIHVWGQVNFRADVRVQRSGDIYLPQVGEIHVADLPASALDEHLRAAISRVYKNFDLTVEVGQIRAVQVYVAGEARRPGVYTVSSLSTLVDALFASGGPSTSGSLRRIELRRGGATVTAFDLYALLIRGDKSKDAPLQSGDVIYIPPVGPQVALTGSVRNPAIYEMREGETVAEALADAGGTSAVAAQKRISVERIGDHRDRHTMEVAFDKAGLATLLADGDLIQVLSILPSYEKTVILRGNTANPGRFAWHEGMKLSDLIPDKESLITRNYWWRRAQLGLPAPEFEPLQSLPEIPQPSQPVSLTRLAQQAAATQANSGNTAPGTATTNPNFANATQNAAVAGGLIGNFASSGINQANAAGQQQLTAAQRAGTSSLAAQQEQTANATEGTPQTRVGPIAPEIDWDYAVVERQDAERLNTKLIPFDLGRLVLQHDPTQDLPLQPGDVVTVFSQADIHVPIGQQTKFVRLDGEFVHAGVYTVQPGESLPELVRRAGGFTRNAYLYGSEFTRESTRAVQQTRLDEYVQTLEMQMQRGNLALASSAASSAQDLASGAAAQSGEQALVAQLRQLKATGRIVLEMKPGSQGVQALPNITLENGDRFIVPPVPASVNVVGAVYDQNSFLYLGSRRAGDYLHLAGGPNRDADRKDVFIIRADGSVISRSAASGLWGNEFDALRMNPGDTIVVPEKGFRPSALRGFLDWSTLFSQFALGAAAVKAVY
ncbi:MAG TPA: polysaccharide biosynthesis/export family protein [Acidobacteriaceae bacterium]|nr:polysaccharide biosynthesis/export family protein [Acidobacteriaceae bacterium]